MRWRPRPPLPDRAVDYAWELMAPRLHAEGFSLADAEFLAGLALGSTKQGQPVHRRAAPMAALKQTEQVAQTRGDVAGPLAALRRLAVHDAVAEGKDPVPLVVAELGDCLEGRLPLAYGEALLTDWATDWWTPGNLARLRRCCATGPLRRASRSAICWRLASRTPPWGRCWRSRMPAG